MKHIVEWIDVDSLAGVDAILVSCTVNWNRQLKSGQKVSYNDLPKREVYLLAFALDEWEMIVSKKATSK